MGSFLARRLLLEMFNMWPESVPFRDVADLNFESYLAVIKVRGKKGFRIRDFSKSRIRGYVTQTERYFQTSII